jgi:hypothetical protein
MELVRVLLLHSQETAEVIRLSDGVRAAAEAAADEPWATTAHLAHEIARHYTGADADTDALEASARRALELLAPHEHYLGLGMAEGALTLVASMRLDSRGVREHDDRSAEYTERGGWPRLAETLRRTTKWSNMSGSLPASEGLARVRAELPLASSRTGRAQCLVGIAFFAGLLGRTEESDAAWAAAEQVAASLGADYPHYVRYGRARLAAYTGHWPEALELFEGTVARFERSGEQGVLSTELGYLAHALLWSGEPERARVAADRARALGAAEDALTHGTAFGAAAWVAGLDGDRAALESALTRALEVLPVDQRAERMMAHLAAGEGLLALGDPAAADDQRRLALAAAEEHENLVVADRLREQLGDA